MDFSEKTNRHVAVDYYFAKRVAPGASEEVHEFLADLLQAAREGHLCVYAKPGLELPSPLFEETLVEQRGRIYLRRNWECEQNFLRHFHRLKTAKPSQDIPTLNLEALEPEQAQAVQNGVSRSLSLICGGPGTGKTFTATILIQNYLPFLESVVVAAPTGKATANLRRALRGLCPVVTLHSLLKKKYVMADLVVVDEASMIDAEMMSTLFASIKEGARLILIGDRDQLPPIETGHFFADLANEKGLITELKKCLRAELNEIIELGHMVKEGRSVPTFPLPPFEALVEGVFERKACILTPLRHGPFGVERLNHKLLEEHRQRGASRFPIMITVNDAAQELYNGDVGELVPEERCAYFGERRVAEYLLPQYEYAYVISVHKSQGSEYDEVMILLPEGSEVFGKEMLYTAITRAKKRVAIYAAEGILPQIVAKRENRLSGIGQ